MKTILLQSLKIRSARILAMTAVLLGGNAFAEDIYSQTFTGGTGALAGTTTTVGNGTWTPNSPISSVIDLNGNTTAQYGSISLPFTPQSGFIYDLTATINVTAANGSWLGVGFLENNDAYGFLGVPNVSNNKPAALRRGGDWQVWPEATNIGWTSNDVLIRLDTSNSTWTSTMFQGGVQMGATRDIVAAPINYVGIVTEGAAVGNVSAFKLTATKATVIYSQNFTGGTGALAGTTTTVGNGTWTPDIPSSNDIPGSNVIDLNGNTTAQYGSISLPFTPQSGFIYDLTATINVTAANGSWLGVGFLENNDAYGFLGVPNVSNNKPAALRRGGDWQVWPEATNIGWTSNDVLIRLDTRNSTWTSTMFQGGVQMGTTQNIVTAPINYVGIVTEGAAVGSVSAFKLIALSNAPTFTTWASTNTGGQTANLDYDSDGVSNGVEYFMNAAPGFTSNPALVGNTVTWPNGGKIPSSAYGSQFQVQKSTDLANWSAVASDDINLSNTAGALTWKVASISNGNMDYFTGNLPSSWGVSGGALTSDPSADNSPFTNKFADNGSSWIIDDSTDASGSAGFLQAFSNKTNYPSVEVNFDFKLTALTGGTWGIQFDGDGVVDSLSSSSVHYRIDAAGQFAINAGPGGGVITNILTLEADKWYNVRATFTTTAVNTGSNNGAGVQSGTITPEGGSPVSWSNVPLLNTSLGFSRLLVRDRDATFAGDLLLDNVSVAPQGKEFVRLKVTPN